MKCERIPQQELRKAAARATITYAEKNDRHWDRQVQQQLNSTYSPLTIRATPLIVHRLQNLLVALAVITLLKWVSARTTLLRERSWRK
ncbi:MULTISPECIES: hypothetical protein [Aerosakkonema]|uniref:hypothetical protein n=1 Tax=Aerosakkonema TaxID=1246629 RepID=UPI0035B8106E